MLNFTKTVSCSVIGTAQQIDTKLMHHFEKSRKKSLGEILCHEELYFSDTRAETGKTLVWGLLQCKTLEVSNLAMRS